MRPYHTPQSSDGYIKSVANLPPTSYFATGCSTVRIWVMTPDTRMVYLREWPTRLAHHLTLARFVLLDSFRNGLAMCE